MPTNLGFDIAWNPANDAVAFAFGDSPYIFVYAWSGSGFGTKYANPATLPGSVNSTRFSNNGDALGMSTEASPFVNIYPWSGSGFGTKYADPATTPGDVSNGFAFN